MDMRARICVAVVAATAPLSIYAKILYMIFFSFFFNNLRLGSILSDKNVCVFMIDRPSRIRIKNLARAKCGSRRLSAGEKKKPALYVWCKLLFCTRAIVPNIVEGEIFICAIPEGSNNYTLYALA